jgi:hypothetical protein
MADLSRVIPNETLQLLLQLSLPETVFAGGVVMTVAARGSVRLRDIFGKSFRLYGRHFAAFSLLAAIAISPFYLPALATRPAGQNWAIWTGNCPGWALAAYAERRALIRICGS